MNLIQFQIKKDTYMDPKLYNPFNVFVCMCISVPEYNRYDNVTRASVFDDISIKQSGMYVRRIFLANTVFSKYSVSSTDQFKTHKT